jgi:hypothetical protein
MAPRANWKGYLRLSLVSCPIALYPASSHSEKVSFNRGSMPFTTENMKLSHHPRFTGTHRTGNSRFCCMAPAAIENPDCVQARNPSF